VLIAAIGHSGYTFVPGVGPWAYEQVHFQHALEGGVWWHRTIAAVKDAGAMLDIFPSLHTAFSLLIGLHALRYRRDPLLSFVWLPTLFAVLNVIIATVFLRWHYGVDLIAGALLAVVAQRAAIVAWRWEGDRASSRGLQAVWEPVLPPEMPSADRSLIIALFFMQLVAVGCLLHFA
jgi:membrane-associated phospholipid phosphatase